MRFVIIVAVLFGFSNSYAQTDVENVDEITLEAPSEIENQDDTTIEDEVSEITLSSESSDDDGVNELDDIPASQKIKEAKQSVSVQTPAVTKKETVSLGEVSGTQNYKITCVLNDDIREITSVTQADGSVGIIYKRFDEIKTIALAKTNPEYADQVADKIHTNLANGKYPYNCTKE